MKIFIRQQFIIVLELQLAHARTRGKNFFQPHDKYSNPHKIGS